MISLQKIGRWFAILGMTTIAVASTSGPASAAALTTSVTSCQITSVNGAAITPTTTYSASGTIGDYIEVGIAFGAGSTPAFNYFGNRYHMYEERSLDGVVLTAGVNTPTTTYDYGDWFEAGTITINWYQVASTSPATSFGSPLCTLTLKSSSSANFGHSDKTNPKDSRNRKSFSDDPSGQKPKKTV